MRYEPVHGTHPHWDLILQHIGSDLNDVTDGYRYLLLWIAIMIRLPAVRDAFLPYLFLHGPQKSGKSILFEAIDLLLTSGVVSADQALTSDFNGALENAILCFIEETDIARDGVYARIKHYSTALTLPIRKMYTDQFNVPNHCHFLQTANDSSACPLEYNDTRIVSIYVAPLEQEIPKDQLLRHLREEAPHFTHTLLSIDLPEADGRAYLPVLETSSKLRLIEASIPEFIDAIVSTISSDWTGTLAELGDLLGPGRWPADLRAAKRLIAQNHKYLSDHGLAVTYPGRNKRGAMISFTHDTQPTTPRIFCQVAAREPEHLL